MGAVGPAIGPSPDAGRVIPDDTWGALCIFAEARNEPFEGQVAVGCVIRNRMARRWFSDGTVVDTVTRAKQFSWTNEDDAQRTRVFRAMQTDPAWLSAVRAWEESAHTNPIGAAVQYHAEYVTPWWSRAHGYEFVKRIGRHLFYEVVRK
jgi:spore germination cell wall hydrolase CwlJ-like protein